MPQWCWYWRDMTVFKSKKKETKTSITNSNSSSNFTYLKFDSSISMRLEWKQRSYKEKNDFEPNVSSNDCIEINFISMRK